MAENSANGNGVAMPAHAIPPQLQDRVSSTWRDLISNDMSLFPFWDRSTLMRLVFGDPRKDIDAECGYPDYILPVQYRALYDRDGIARRVNNIYPEESWAQDPNLFEIHTPHKLTRFEKAWQDNLNQHNLWHFLERIDKVSGIGMFGLMLIGIDDGLPLDHPIENIDEFGNRRDKLDPHKLLYLRTFDESLVTILNYETDPSSPRYGYPTFYNVRFVDVWSMDYVGFIPSTGGLIQRVHWSRLLHIADNRLTTEVFGQPRCQDVWNRIYDIRKILGADGEGYWKGGFPGLSVETHPNIETPELNVEELKKMMFEYTNGLQRFLALKGMTAKSLNSQTPSPKEHFDTQMQAIATAKGIPMRIFMGTEEAKLASTQDARAWNLRIQRRQQKYVTPMLIRPFVDRLITMGVLPMPKEYFVEWSDLNALSDKDQADYAAKITTALGQYVTMEISSLIGPFEYLTIVCGFDEKKVELVLKAAGMNAKTVPAVGHNPNMGPPANPVSTKGRPQMGSPISNPTPQGKDVMTDSKQKFKKQRPPKKKKKTVKQFSVDDAMGSNWPWGVDNPLD